MNTKLRYSMIVAVSENGVIGDGVGMPWRQSADLKRFKSLTMGHHIMMGRKTYETIGKPLPGRTNIILSRDQNYKESGCHVFNRASDALYLAQTMDVEKFFVIGGAEIYNLLFSEVNALYLTRIHAQVKGDTSIELGNLNVGWDLSSSESHKEDEKNQYPYTFEVYQRKDKK